jgi:hypothetical protein
MAGLGKRIRNGQTIQFMKTKHQFNFTIIIVLTGWSVLMTGCSDHHSKATFEYLNAVHAVLENTTLNFKQHELPKIPSPPTITNQTPAKQRMAEMRQYNANLAQYWPILIESSQQRQKLLLDSQNQLSAVSADEVDPDAITHTRLVEQELGDAVQIYIELESFAKMKLTDIQQNKQNNPLGPFVAGMLIGIGTDDPFAGLATFAKDERKNVDQKMEAQQQEQSEAANLQRAITAFKSDKAQTITRRNELMITLATKYSGYQWSSIWTNATDNRKD